MAGVSTQLLDWGAASQPISGEERSGDGLLVHAASWGVLVAVADGLGHGPDAEAAARAALSVIERYAEEPLHALLVRCHQSLRGTRGATLALCAVHAVGRTISWVGVGNVAGVLLRADPHASPRMETLVPRSGLLGDHLPLVTVSSIGMARGDTLVLATDGVRSAFTEGLSREETPARLAARLLASYRRGTDDALVLVARYAERAC